MTVQDDVYLAALAGLLHDVGKFAQRADAVPDTASQAFGPEDYGAHGAHAKWSISFIHDRVPARWRAGLSPVLYHHKPQDRLSKVVALANRLSAAEREGSGEGHSKQLISIFCQIGTGDARPAQRVWPLKPLSLEDDTLFPISDLDSQAEMRAYGDLWAAFDAQVQNLPDDDLPAYLEGLLYASQRHTWCVPGAFYESVPDVSLYDHSRTTAALAACLVGLEEHTLDDLLAGRRRDEPLALLVGGDLSGVQDFIYTITARGAAKGLRGRSFYLQLLTEAVARFVLRTLQLPVTNLIYGGGGHFYLLAPREAAAQLASIRTDVSRKLLAHHGGDLYLALGWTPAAAQDFDRARFSNRWEAVSQEMSRAKRQRFAELDDAALLTTQVFGPGGAGGGEEGECQICHYDGPGVETEPGPEDDAEKRRICRLCASLENLGADLRDADYLLLGEIAPQDVARAGYAEALQAFGMAVGFAAADGRPVLRLPGTVQRAALLAMRDLPDGSGTVQQLAQELGCPVASGTRYTVNVTPRKPDGDVATFDWLQAQSRGVERLGILRMDVDDLGDLFKGMQDATLSRVAALSSALSLFFEGWVGELCRRANRKAGTDKLYAIYSGGDDLFVVGAWDALPGLARAIRRDLGRFTADNPAARISGGLTLHAGKYPLYQAAAKAEEARGAAKDKARAGGRREDALNFLDLTIPWEAFDDIQREAQRLVKLVQPRDAGGLGRPQALLHVLLRLYTHFAAAAHERGKAYWGPWMWQGAYFLKRMEGRSHDEDVRAEIKRIRESLKENEFRHIETLGPAARWAELLTRKE
jgi:CRISPR-associated protein Csm1